MRVDYADPALGLNRPCPHSCPYPHCTTCELPWELVQEESSEFHKTFKPSCTHLPNMRISIG